MPAHQSQHFNLTYQLLTISLSLLAPPDLHIHLVAGMLEFDLQGSLLSLCFGENLLARPQLLLKPQPFSATVIKVECHLNELCKEGEANKDVAGIFTRTCGILSQCNTGIKGEARCK